MNDEERKQLARGIASLYFAWKLKDIVVSGALKNSNLIDQVHEDATLIAIHIEEILEGK